MAAAHERGCVQDAGRRVAVHTGARVAALAAPGEILVSRTIRDLVAGSPIRLECRGTHELKGVPGPWEIFAVTAWVIWASLTRLPFNGGGLVCQARLSWAVCGMAALTVASHGP
jgi:hypothetical protein